MSWSEWLGERFNPGEYGSVETGERYRRYPSWTVMIVRFVIAAALLGVAYYLVFEYLAVPTTNSITWAIGITAAYLLLGYYVHPRPDTSNMGWLGGLMDNPFRWSDDVNRCLLFLTLLLWPGRFVAESLHDLVVCALARST
jgi:hypothetical protein